MRVFVYGTLLAGEGNHHCLQGAECLGEWTTPPRFSLYDTGPFPVLCDHGQRRVRGEVYAINGAFLKRLDQLEGYPHHYLRALISTPWGPAWFYYQRRVPARARMIPGGDWRRR